MEKLRVVFMGTPEFAVPCLAALQADEGCEVIGVYTQPDKPRGRGQKLLPSPVKAWAELKSLKPDLVVVVAFGQILSQEILDIPPKGCINVHGSLLPRYRGAAPMQWCVINGEKKTGITTMMMDAGLDTGDINTFRGSIHSGHLPGVAVGFFFGQGVEFFMIGVGPDGVETEDDLFVAFTYYALRFWI